MIPLRDTIRSRSFPIVNWIIIGINALIFLFENTLSPADLERLFDVFGLVPNQLSVFQPFSLITIFSSMFLHGGWIHFISNMWILYIFGDNVEDRMGSLRYLLFYVLSGVTAGVLQGILLQGPGGNLPTIGASGAIAGVMGAYIIFFPTSRIVTLVPVFLFPWIIKVPAIIYLGLWFLSQLYSGLFALAMPTGASMGGVAWWAHIGGFLFGLLLGRVFLRRVPQYYYRDIDEYRF